MSEHTDYPPTWPEAERERPSAVRRLVGRVGRTVIKGVGGAVLVATGLGLPRAGEDRLWRLRHPDDDDVNPFWDQ